MYQQKFVDRREEMGFLEERYKSGSPEFVVLYGRKRVGKTELLLKFLETKRGFISLPRPKATGKTSGTSPRPPAGLSAMRIWGNWSSTAGTASLRLFSGT